MATRGDHARAIAVACGNPLPGPDIVAALVGWSMRETGGSPRPGNNMLSCGQWEPGVTNFNSAGVRNYPTIGVEASAINDNLSAGFNGYKELKSAIARGVWDSSVVQGLITWVGHDAYGSQYASFIADGKRNINSDYVSGGLVFGTGTSNSSGGQKPPGNTDPLTQLIIDLATPLLNASNFLQALSNIAKDPIRLMKFIVGLLVFGVGLLMVFVDVIELVSNSQPGQAIKKTAAAAGKVAELAA